MQEENHGSGSKKKRKRRRSKSRPVLGNLENALSNLEKGSVIENSQGYTPDENGSHRVGKYGHEPGEMETGPYLNPSKDLAQIDDVLEEFDQANSAYGNYYDGETQIFESKSLYDATENMNKEETKPKNRNLRELQTHSADEESASDDAAWSKPESDDSNGSADDDIEIKAHSGSSLKVDKFENESNNSVDDFTAERGQVKSGKITDISEDSVAESPERLPPKSENADEVASLKDSSNNKELNESVRSSVDTLTSLSSNPENPAKESTNASNTALKNCEETSGGDVASTSSSTDPHAEDRTISNELTNVVDIQEQSRLYAVKMDSLTGKGDISLLEVSERSTSTSTCTSNDKSTQVDLEKENAEAAINPKMHGIGQRGERVSPKESGDNYLPPANILGDKCTQTTQSDVQSEVNGQTNLVIQLYLTVGSGVEHLTTISDPMVMFRT